MSRVVISIVVLLQEFQGMRMHAEFASCLSQALNRIAADRHITIQTSIRPHIEPFVLDTDACVAKAITSKRTSDMSSSGVFHEIG